MTVPTNHTCSQCPEIVQEKNKVSGCPVGHSCRLPSHLNDPGSTHTLELDSCSPKPQSLICAGSAFSQWYLLNALRFAAVSAFSFYSADQLGVQAVQASRSEVYLDKLFLESPSVFRLQIRGPGPLFFYLHGLQWQKHCSAFLTPIHILSRFCLQLLDTWEESSSDFASFIS